MSAAHTPMTLGDLVHVRVDGHNEPIAMLPIVTAERMNAGSGIALVAYRQPDDRAMAQCMAAAHELLEAQTMGPSLNTPDFLDWLADRLVSKCGEDSNADFVLSLRARAAAGRAAIAKATGGAQ